MSERNLQLPSLHLTYQFSSGTASSNRAKHPPPPAKPELRQRNSDRCMEFVLQCGTGPCCQATTGVKSRGPLHRIQGRTTNHGFGLFKGDLAQTIPPWIRRLDIFWCRSLRWELHGITISFWPHGESGLFRLFLSSGTNKWQQVAASLEVVGRSFDIPFIRLRILANRSGKQKGNSTWLHMKLLKSKRSSNILQNEPPWGSQGLRPHLAHQRPSRWMDVGAAYSRTCPSQCKDSGQT